MLQHAHRDFQSGQSISSLYCKISTIKNKKIKIKSSFCIEIVAHVVPENSSFP